MPIAKRKRQQRYDFNKLDASENAFLARSLEYVKARTYDIKFPALRAREFVPVNNEVDNAAQTVTYRQYSQVGMAKLIASYADDLPRSDVKATEFSIQIKSAGDSYGYNLQEIRAAARAGVDLDGKKAAAARRAMEVLFDRIIAKGDAATGMLGLLNQPNALTFTVPNGGGGQATWASKTPAEILKDMIDICEYVPTQTKEVEQVDVLLLPRAQFVKVATTRFSDSSDLTILEVFKRNYANGEDGRSRITVERWDTLDGAGSGGADRMMAYKRDPEHLEAIIPQEFEQLPVEARNLEFVVNCHARIGGVLAYYPMSMVYGDGI